MTKSTKDESPLDHEDFTIGQILRALGRLKLKSAVGLAGILAVAGGGVYTLGVANGSSAARSDAHVMAGAAAVEFADGFAVQFVDRQVLQALVPDIQSESPDGLGSYEEVMASLLWQVKSQNGFAEFLSGEKSIAVDVSFEEESVQLDWDRRSNLLLRIADNVGVALDDSSLRQLNAELNVLGVAWLDEFNYVVRGVDGGLRVVGVE